MKKALLALSLLSTTLPLSARELWCEQCEENPEPCCPEHLFVERSQIYVSTEFLYWTAVTNAADFAVKPAGTTPSTAVFATGDYTIADYDWNPGFRVGLAYYRCPRYWEVNAEYTWFYTESSKRISSEFVRPTRLTVMDGPFQTARSVIDAHYHVGDFYADRVFDPNPHLRLRLIGGLTTAYIEQSHKINYTNAAGSAERIKESWRYFGGGVRMGLRADWFWGCQFYLTGKTTFAGMIGSYKNEEVQINTNTKDLFGDATYDDHRMTFHSQFLLGPSWQVPCDCWSFELLAAYEFNVWLNLNERIRSFQSAMNTDSTETYYATGLFGTHGLTLRLNIGF